MCLPRGLDNEKPFLGFDFADGGEAARASNCMDNEKRLFWISQTAAKPHVPPRAWIMKIPSLVWISQTAAKPHGPPATWIMKSPSFVWIKDPTHHEKPQSDIGVKKHTLRLGN